MFRISDGGSNVSLCVVRIRRVHYSVYVCPSAYMCMCVRVFACVRVCVYAYVWVYARQRNGIWRKWMYKCAYVCVFVWRCDRVIKLIIVCTYSNICVHVWPCAYLNIYTHTYTHTHIHTCTHTRTRNLATELTHTN